MSSNRIVEVEREMVAGLIEGVDFGADLYLLARSPAAALVWQSGHSWSLNGHQRYAESHMVMLPIRSGQQDLSKCFKSIGRLGGRLTGERVMESAAEIDRLFFEPIAGHIASAVAKRRTLIIDGGGPPLMPARKLGQAAYDVWWSLPERGFVVREPK